MASKHPIHHPDTEHCERCGEALDVTPICLVEALEEFAQVLCDGCFDSLCEDSFVSLIAAAMQDGVRQREEMRR